MNSIFTKRKDQLKLQKEIDENLKKYTHKCPKKILKLVLHERKLNRDQMDSFNDLNPITIYEKIKKNLEDLDVLYEKMRKFNC